ncbi:zf-HC2 domain-containing protein [Actinomadura barringtoniae]|uniref:Zf-HC2 domain-containing protein n=1 Tax=Actinomadura barringtoniae TaxID=1427535 RepID=A0A939T9N5_9ACTN|nr:zf-HC2 domain-containing protein [Actinomadura barringtoniae]MBO2451582.1 zf-HC2 domain-containing protein [Actinomadura barringtoniae]
MNERWPCAQVRELIPEIAAGAATGDERARALEHLTACADCRRELAEIADLFDGLMLLTPEKQTPPGFESRTLERLALEKRRSSAFRSRTFSRRAHQRPRRVSRTVRWAAALITAAAVAAAAAGAVWWRTAPDRELAANYRHTLHVAHGKDFRAAPLVPTGSSEIATIFAYEGVPSWVYAIFRQPPRSGHYTVTMIVKDGRRYALNPFDSEGDTHGWGSRIQAPVHIRDIRTIEFRTSGTIAMTANFP